MAVRKYSSSWTLRKSWRPIETPLGTFYCSTNGGIEHTRCWRNGPIEIETCMEKTLLMVLGPLSVNFFHFPKNIWYEYIFTGGIPSAACGTIQHCRGVLEWSCGVSFGNTAWVPGSTGRAVSSRCGTADRTEQSPAVVWEKQDLLGSQLVTNNFWLRRSGKRSQNWALDIKLVG